MKSPPLDLGGSVPRCDDPGIEGRGGGFRKKSRFVRERNFPERTGESANGDSRENGEVLLTGRGEKRVLTTFVDRVLDGEFEVGVSDEGATYEKGEGWEKAGGERNEKHVLET